MLNIPKHIAEGFGKGELYNVLVGLNNGLGVMPVDGTTFYVSKTGNGTTGLDWENAFSTLTAAITAASAAAVVNTNTLNRIFLGGGNWTETLVALPNHCEIIGVGIMSDGPRINGTSAIANAPSICHIYNVQFRTNTAAPCLDLTVGAQGLWLIGCLFNNTSGQQTTVGVDFGDTNYYNKIIGCTFMGNPSMTRGIVCNGAANAFMEIRDNYISAITSGIEFAAQSGAYSDYQCYIRENVICRTDPNSSSQLAVGVHIKDTQSRTDLMTIHNYISAAIAIEDEGTIKANNHIGNYCLMAGTQTNTTIS